MANEKVICDKADLVAIADAVREKNGSSDTYYVSELAEAVNSLPDAGSGGSGGRPETCTVDFTIFGGDGTKIYYSAYENNNIVTKDAVVSGWNLICSATMSNVVCGTMIYADYAYGNESNISFGDYGDDATSTTVLLISVTDRGIIFQAPSVDGENCSILIT